jgi:hypothetical protein
MSLVEQHLREFARASLRAGLLPDADLRREVAQAVAMELPARAGEAQDVAGAWLAEAREELSRDQRAWPEVTDYDLLQRAFADIERAGIVVLQGCEDHWAAKALLDERAAVGSPPRGVAWFTAPDVWHAVDEGMLEVNLWHGNTANAAPGDALLDEVVAAFGRHGLEAHFDEGRIEVAAHWHRRQAT